MGLEDVGAYLYAPGHLSSHLSFTSDAACGRCLSETVRNVRGLDLVELPEAEECCGFGGMFAIKNADTSMAMLGDKIRHINEIKAEACASLDNSCLMHIGGALSRQRSGVEPVHLAEILASSENPR